MVHGSQWTPCWLGPGLWSLRRWGCGWSGSSSSGRAWPSNGELGSCDFIWPFHMDNFNYKVWLNWECGRFVNTVQRIRHMTAFSQQFAADSTCFSRPSPWGGALPSTPCEPTHPGLPRASRRTKENFASELRILATGIWNILVYSWCRVAPYIYI